MNNNFQSLNNQYNTLLTQYKETYQKYIQSFKDSSYSNLVIVPNSVFWGSSGIQNNVVNSVDDCLNSCSTTDSCSGATYNSSTNTCYLRKGGGMIVSASNENQSIVPNSLQYSYQLKKMNQELLLLNKQMMDLQQSSYKNYQANSQTKQQQEIILVQNDSILQDERLKIEKMIQEEKFMNAANQNSELVLTQYYSRYIVYLFVVVLLIALVMKFTIGDWNTPNRELRGGSIMNNRFFKKFWGK